jgi:hypothetical protein
MAAERAAQLRAQMAERMVDRQDDNGDGKLSPDELRMARMGEGFLERFDTDGDGTVTKAEYDAAMTSMQRGHMGKGERKGKGRMRERGGHHDGDGGGWFGWRLGRDHH